MGDLKMMQGAWRIVYAESEGAPIPTSQYENIHIEISGDIGTETDGANSMTVQFHLHPFCVPKAIDSTYLSGPGQGFTSLGIYQLDPHEFRMCRTSKVGDPRPKTFTTTAGTGLMMVIWNRPKD